MWYANFMCVAVKLIVINDAYYRWPHCWNLIASHVAEARPYLCGWSRFVVIFSPFSLEVYLIHDDIRCE